MVHAVVGDLVYVNDEEVRGPTTIPLSLARDSVVSTILFFTHLHIDPRTRTHACLQDEAKEGKEKRVRLVTAEEEAAGSVDIGRVVLPLPGASGLD